MIELFLSSDGKHTVHIAAETPEKFQTLVPHAKAYYEAIVKNYGNKAQMWQGAINGRSSGQTETKQGRRIDTPEQAAEAVAPSVPCTTGRWSTSKASLAPSGRAMSVSRTADGVR